MLKDLPEHFEGNEDQFESYVFACAMAHKETQLMELKEQIKQGYSELKCIIKRAEESGYSLSDLMKHNA